MVSFPSSPPHPEAIAVIRMELTLHLAKLPRLPAQCAPPRRSQKAVRSRGVGPQVRCAAGFSQALETRIGQVTRNSSLAGIVAQSMGSRNSPAPRRSSLTSQLAHRVATLQRSDTPKSLCLAVRCRPIGNRMRVEFTRASPADSRVVLDAILARQL